MALKSILDIEVEDGKFKRFAELFGKYQEALAKTPNVWAKVGKEQSELVKTSQMMTAAIMAQSDHMREIAAAEREQQRHLTTAGRLWTGIAGSARSVASHVLRATGALLRWTGALGAVGGLLGIGGLFGLDRMASDVGEQRRSAMGLGMSIGSMKAFGTDFGRVVNPGSFLQGVMQMRTNPAMSGALWALGVNPDGSERNVALATMNALRARARATPADQLGLILQELPGLQGVTVEDLQRMKSMSGAEWAAQMGHFARDRRSMNIGSSTALGWQNFATQLERAGQQIFKTFVVGLAPLEKPLSNLSRSFVHVLQVLMRKNGLIEEGINDFAKWLADWNGKISSPAFLKKIEGFTSDMGALADGLHHIVQMFHLSKHIVYKAGHNNPETLGEKWGEETRNWLYHFFTPRGLRNNNPGNLMFAHQPGASAASGGFAKFGTPIEGLMALGRQLELYSKHGKDTIASILSTYAPAKAGNNVPAYISAAVGEVGVSGNQRLNLNNPGILAKFMDAIIRHENSGRDPYYGRLQGIARTVIRVENATGGSAIIAANGLAQ